MALRKAKAVWKGKLVQGNRIVEIDKVESGSKITQVLLSLKAEVPQMA
jgi:hypothetical protein